MKKPISILLVAVLSMSLLIGCSNGADPANTDAPPISEPPAQSPSPAPSPPPSPVQPPTSEPPPEPTPTAPAPVFDTGAILISAEELTAFIDDDNLILIGVINPAGEQDPASNAANPISGSYLIWTSDYLGANPESFTSRQTFYRAPLADFENLLSRAGITANSNVVVYSSDMLQQGSFIAWYLRMMGLNARFLDGGVAAWRSIGGATGNSTRLSGESVKNTFSAPDYNPASYDATLEMVIEAALNPSEWVIIDTRAAGEYNGETAGAGSFGAGRINGAVHIEWIRTLDPANPGEGLIISDDQLMQLYSFIGNRKVITYCTGGLRSAHTWMLLTDLGFDAFNYNGGWIEFSYAASADSDYPKDVISDLVDAWTDNEGPL